MISGASRLECITQQLFSSLQIDKCNSENIFQVELPPAETLRKIGQTFPIFQSEAIHLIEEDCRNDDQLLMEYCCPNGEKVC